MMFSYFVVSLLFFVLVLLRRLCFFFFFFMDPPPTEISSLPLHDALPISASEQDTPPLPGQPCAGVDAVTRAVVEGARRDGRRGGRIPDQHVGIGAGRQGPLARVMAERPGRIRAGHLREPLDRQAPGQAVRQEQRESRPDARDPVAVAPPVRGELPGGPRAFLAVVGAHRVEGPVRECLPQRFEVTGRPERRGPPGAPRARPRGAAGVPPGGREADPT